MSKIRTCVLHPLDNSYDSIQLPHKKPVVLGRNPFTKVTDKRCSRSQVQVEADVENLEVKVTHVGVNRAGVNGFALEKKSSITLKHNDAIELMLGDFIYRIEFDPLPCEGSSKKRQLTDIDDSVAKRHCGGSEEDDNAVDVAGTSPGTSYGTSYGTSNRNYFGNSSSLHKLTKGWKDIDHGKLLIYTSSDCESKPKIAAFDLDGTIITTKSGKVFPVHCDDWKIAFSETPKQLKKLVNDGYKIVILTNQAGIGRGKVNVKDFKSKVEAILQKLNVPVQVYVSTGKGIYRKPAPGMWNSVVEMNELISIDMTESFYCGDAAGRPVNWAPKKKKDFSLADRLFALNLKLKFYTPEEFFLKARTAPFNLPEFNPSKLAGDAPLVDNSGTSVTSNSREVVILVGPPGSGKSHFAKTYLVTKGYFHVNRDTLGSWQKCVSELERGLSQGKSVVVDNTNPDKDSRKRFLNVAKKHRVPCRCFVLSTSLHHAKHNNRFRELTDDSHQEITDMVINSYMKKYQEPSSDEDFNEVVKINCVPKFDNPENEKLYKMFLLEK